MISIGGRGAEVLYLPTLEISPSAASDEQSIASEAHLLVARNKGSASVGMSGSGPCQQGVLSKVESVAVLQVQRVVACIYFGSDSVSDLALGSVLQRSGARNMICMNL